MLPNGTVRLHHPVQWEDLHAAVCKQTGWNYLTKEYVSRQETGDIPLTPPDYRGWIVEVYEKCNPAKLSEVDYLLEKYRGVHKQLYARICAKYGVVPRERTGDRIQLVPRERAKLKPLMSAASIFEILYPSFIIFQRQMELKITLIVSTANKINIVRNRWPMSSISLPQRLLPTLTNR